MWIFPVRNFAYNETQFCDPAQKEVQLIWKSENPLVKASQPRQIPELKSSSRQRPASSRPASVQTSLLREIQLANHPDSYWLPVGHRSDVVDASVSRLDVQICELLHVPVAPGPPDQKHWMVDGAASWLQAEPRIVPFPRNFDLPHDRRSEPHNGFPLATPCGVNPSDWRLGPHGLHSATSHHPWHLVLVFLLGVCTVCNLR